MSDIEIPTQRDLMYPTLVAVRDLGGSAKRSELESKVVEIVGITDRQLDVVFPDESSQPGMPKVLNRIQWAIASLKGVGVLENSERSVLSITQKGLKYLEMPKVKSKEALGRDYNAVLAEQRKTRKKRKDESEGDDDHLQDDAAEIEGDWKDKLLGALKGMDPSAFERLAMRILKEAGFRNVKVRGKPGDEGIDGVGVYRVSLVSFPTYFQCKRYSGSVSAGAVRDFRGAMSGRGEKGILITTGTFTPAARSEAARDGAPPVDLIDGDELCDLLVEYEIGARVEERVVKDFVVDRSFFENL